MISIDNYLFLSLTIVLLIWLHITIKHLGVKGLYFLYFFLNVTIFYGPICYYQLGFKSYILAMSDESLFEFSLLSLTFFIINIFVLKITFLKQAFIFKNFFGNISFDKLENKNKITTFYILTYIVILAYMVIFYKHFPLVKLISGEELGERLDITGDIPLYITFSAITMIFIPSGYFYFTNMIKNQFALFLLLLLCIFLLSAGGNKGIVSYFLIFYFLLSSKSINILKITLLITTLIIIYGALKGVNNLSPENINYLIDSPVRRLFVSQGSGYITRIEMINNNAFHTGLAIKKEVYSNIYNTPYNSGTSPTHFTGNIVVTSGYLVTILIYTVFTIIFTRILFTLDMLKIKKENTFFMWNLFLFSYLITYSEFDLANFIRIGLMLINLFFIKNISRIKI